MAPQRDDEQGAQPRPEGQSGPPSWDHLAPEVTRRVNSILDVVEREAISQRQEAKEEARRYIEYAKRRADGLVAERQQRLSDLSDELIARAERVLGRLEAAEPTRAAFEDLVRSLGEAAERLASETGGFSDFVAPPYGETPAEAPLPPAPAEPPPEPPRAEPPPESPRAEPLPEPPRAEPPPEPPRAEPPPARPPRRWTPWPRHAAKPAASTPPPVPREPAPPAQSRPLPSPFPPQPPAPPPSRGGRGEQKSQNLDGAQMVAIEMAAAGCTRGQVETHVRDSLGVADPSAMLDEVFGPGRPD